MREGDMLVNLYRLPPEEHLPSVRIVRAFAGDRQSILRFVKAQFGPVWLGETEFALLQQPARCFVAVKDNQPVGFACYDATAKGFFGPMGVHPALRGQGVGRALLLRTLHAMRWDGYGYAVIGWVGDAAPFYQKTVGALFIPGGEPEQSVYQNRLAARPPRASGAAGGFEDAP